MDYIQDLARHIDVQALILILFGLLGLRAMGNTFRSPDNNVEAWQFVSSKGTDGKEYGDPEKLAKLVAIFASTLMVMYVFWSEKELTWPLIALFTIWLIFLSGINVFSAWARSFVDRRFGQGKNGSPSAAPAPEEKKS